MLLLFAEVGELLRAGSPADLKSELFVKRPHPTSSGVPPYPNDRPVRNGIENSNRVLRQVLERASSKAGEVRGLSGLL